MEEKPNYYAIIPASVRYDNNLKMGEKLMYGEITSLTYKTGECWASNNYFAELYDVSPQAISKWIKSLETYKYITIDYEKNGNQYLKRIIKLVSTDIDRGINTGLEGYQRTIKENNINNNNTSINKKENIKRKYFDDEEVNNLFNEFLDLRIKLKAKNTDRAITLLLNELNKWNKETQIQMINNSIMSSWKSVFPLKNLKTKAIEPEWMNKEIAKEELTDEQKYWLDYVNGEDKK